MKFIQSNNIQPSPFHLNITYPTHGNSPITCDTVEQAYLHCLDFTRNRQMYGAAIVTEVNGQLIINNRYGEPCFGFLRKYGKGSTRPEDYRPVDLLRDFPDGKRVMLGVPLRTDVSTTKFPNFVEFIFGQDSPYKELFREATVIVDNSNCIVGIVFERLDFDSTLFINFLQFTRHWNYTCKTYEKLKQEIPEFTPQELWLACHLVQLYYSNHNTFVPLKSPVDPKRVLTGDYWKVGGLFSEGDDYARPYVERLWYNENPKTAEKWVTPAHKYWISQTATGKEVINQLIKVVKEISNA